MAAPELPSNTLDNCDAFFKCYADWAYRVTDGFFWTGMLIAFTVTLYIVAARFGTNRAFGFAGVVGALGAMFLAILQLMPWWIASLFIIIGAISLGSLINSER